jgi:hypothetical protein
MEIKQTFKDHTDTDKTLQDVWGKCKCPATWCLVYVDLYTTLKTVSGISMHVSLLLSRHQNDTTSCHMFPRSRIRGFHNTVDEASGPLGYDAMSVHK